MSRRNRSSGRRLALVAGFLAAFILVLIATTYTLHRRTRRHLDGELGERLRAVATGLAQAVEFSTTDSLSVGDLGPEIYSVLFLGKQENNLSNVVVVTPGGETIVDLEGYSAPGELNPFIELDFSAVTLARSGLSAYTELYRTGDTYMKSAYAPVMGKSGRVVAIVGVEAGAAFFDTLRELTRMILIFTGLSILVVVVLGVLFYGQSRSLDRAQEAMSQQENLAAMGRMVANVAHEIRNPLSVIRTSAQRLQRKYDIKDEAITYIIEEVDELNQTLTGYLEFAQSRPARFESFAARRAITRSVLAVHDEAKKKGVDVVEAQSDGAITIKGDEPRLRQAVLNLLLNAVEATEAGGRVEISLSTHGRQAVIIVRDTGAGIPHKEIADIMKPFYTTKAGGSGLGLSVVAAIVEEHGGDIVIESKLGVGTTVRMSLPVGS